MALRKNSTALEEQFSKVQWCHPLSGFCFSCRHVYIRSWTLNWVFGTGHKHKAKRPGIIKHQKTCRPDQKLWDCAVVLTRLIELADKLQGAEASPERLLGGKVKSPMPKICQTMHLTSCVTSLNVLSITKISNLLGILVRVRNAVLCKSLVLCGKGLIGNVFFWQKNQNPKKCQCRKTIRG